MDTAVALTRTYLQLNGYFVVTEYPVVEAVGNSGGRSLTDLDVLAVRFPGAGRLVKRGEGGSIIGEVDGELDTTNERVDMIIAEVKQGEARLNRGAHDPAVMRAAIARFGGCQSCDVGPVVDELLREGSAMTPDGHRLRVMVFASYFERSPGRGVRVITLEHMRVYIDSYIQEHWQTLNEAQFLDPAMAFLMMFEKSKRRSGG